MHRYFFCSYRPIADAPAQRLRLGHTIGGFGYRTLLPSTVLLLAIVSGCASSNMRFQNQTNAAHINSAYMGSSGGSWEAVLPGPDVNAATDSLRTSQASWILSRANDALSLRSPAVPLATNWPTASRPSLDRPRTIQIFRNADSFVYYRHEQHTTNYHTSQ